MDYLQYAISGIKEDKDRAKVLNLIINGLPSILKRITGVQNPKMQF